MTTVTDYPLRTCPWDDCRAIWVEDPIMYEDTTRCPRCGRIGEDFSYGIERDFGEIPGGSGRQKLFLHSMTRGILEFVEGGRIKTVGALKEEDYRI